MQVLLPSCDSQLSGRLNGESIPEGTFLLPRMLGSTGHSAIIPAGLTLKLFCPSLRQHNYPARH